MAAQLRDEGYQKALAMRGGVQAWQAAGYPMGDGPPPGEPRARI